MDELIAKAWKSFKKDFVPTGDRDVDATINRVNAKGEYDAVRRKFPNKTNKRELKEKITPENMRLHPNSRGNYPDLAYSKGIPKEHRDDRFPSDASMSNLKANVSTYDDSKPMTIEEIMDIKPTLPEDKKFKQKYRGNKADVIINDRKSLGAYYPIENNIAIGRKENPVTGVKNFSDLGLNDDDMLDIMLHELTHYSQYVKVDPDDLDFAARKGLEYFHTTGKIPLIERLATVAQNHHDKLGYWPFFTNDEKDRYLGTADPSGYSERDRFIKLWNRMHSEGTWNELSDEQKLDFTKKYQQKSKEWKEADELDKRLENKMDKWGIFGYSYDSDFERKMRDFIKYESESESPQLDLIEEAKKRLDRYLKRQETPMHKALDEIKKDITKRNAQLLYNNYKREVLEYFNNVKQYKIARKETPWRKAKDIETAILKQQAYIDKYKKMFAEEGMSEDEFKREYRYAYTGKEDLERQLEKRLVYEEVEKTNPKKLGKLRSEIGKLENQIRGMDPNANIPFVDLDYIKNNMDLDKDSELRWMNSDKYLQYARPMVLPIKSEEGYVDIDTSNLRDDARSVGYSMDRQSTGRVMPPELSYDKDVDIITSHQGRHRNVANRLLNNKKAQIPVVIHGKGSQNMSSKTVPEHAGYAHGFNRKKINNLLLDNIGDYANQLREDDVRRIRQFGDYGEYGIPDNASDRSQKKAELRLRNRLEEYNTPSVFREANLNEALSNDALWDTKKSMSEAWKDYKRGVNMDKMEKAYEEFQQSGEDYRNKMTKKPKRKYITNAGHNGLKIGGNNSHYDPYTDTIQLGRYKNPHSDEEVDAEDALDKLLHEGQHRVQMSGLSDVDSPPDAKPESKRQVAGRAQALDVFADVVPLIERDAIMAQTNPKTHPNYDRLTEEQKKKYDPYLEKAWVEFKKTFPDERVAVVHYKMQHNIPLTEEDELVLRTYNHHMDHSLAFADDLEFGPEKDYMKQPMIRGARSYFDPEADESDYKLYGESESELGPDYEEKKKLKTTPEMVARWQEGAEERRKRAEKIREEYYKWKDKQYDPNAPPSPYSGWKEVKRPSAPKHRQMTFDKPPSLADQIFSNINFGPEDREPPVKGEIPWKKKKK